MKTWRIRNPTDEEIIECHGHSDECEICPHFTRCVSVTAKHQETDKDFYDDLHLEQIEQM